jgi:uncharacterized protein GlcG (DUF336 family)
MRPHRALVLVALGTWIALAGCGEPEPAEQARVAEPSPASEAEEAREAEAEDARDAGCDALPGADELRRALRAAPERGSAGGLFEGRMEWAALVDRAGRLCAVAVSTDDPADVWPGSQAIAKAKAYTANAFSTDQQPMSTARLYTLAQPGHSLFGLAAGNPFDPDCLATPEEQETGRGNVCGGTITFGGGVPLYRGGVRVGGLGVSGDTACADHEIAKRMRDALGLNPPAGAGADDITYATGDGPSVFSHPLCPNTWRNGVRVGDEPAAGAE